MIVVITLHPEYTNRLYPQVYHIPNMYHCVTLRLARPSKARSWRWLKYLAVLPRPLSVQHLGV